MTFLVLMVIDYLSKVDFALSDLRRGSNKLAISTHGYKNGKQRLYIVADKSLNFALFDDTDNPLNIKGDVMFVYGGNKENVKCIYENVFKSKAGEISFIDGKFAEYLINKNSLKSQIINLKHDRQVVYKSGTLVYHGKKTQKI